MVKQQLRVLCFINYSHLPSSGGEGATQSAVCVSSVQWMMGNAVQCAVWCESQYDGEATSGGYWAEGHRPDS